LCSWFEKFNSGCSSCVLGLKFKSGSSFCAFLWLIVMYFGLKFTMSGVSTCNYCDSLKSLLFCSLSIMHCDIFLRSITIVTDNISANCVLRTGLQVILFSSFV
jgi:hypothetical protein